MSADFISICAVLPAATAHRIHRELASQEWLGALTGPGEETLYEFVRNGPAPDYRSIAELYRGRRPAAAGLQGAHVEIGVGTLSEITDEASACEMPMSPNFASLAVVDRVLALPRGNPILGGHAVARVPAKHLKAFGAAWETLLASAGGAKKAATTLAPYLDRFGNGGDDARTTLEAVGKVHALATAAKRDLLFVCCPVP